MKGRDKELISARDRKLYEQYYYWTEVQRLRFDDTLHILSTQEFFISESRTMQIIRNWIVEGYEMENGKNLTRPGFCGFRGGRPKPKPADVQPSLFPEWFQ